MTHDVFISYSSKDKTAVDTVVEALEEAWINCWIAPRNVRPGMQYGGQILKALAASRLLVLILSPEANASAHVVNEVERAVSKNIPVFPFLIRKVVPSGSLELFISSTQWLDGSDGPMERYLPDLVEAVRGKLKARTGQGREPSPSPNRKEAKKNREAWKRRESWAEEEKQRAEKARKNLANRRQIKEKSEHLLNRGRRALDQGHLTEAMGLLGEVLQLSPDNGEARLLLRKAVTRKIKLESHNQAVEEAEKKESLPDAIKALQALKPLSPDPGVLDRKTDRLFKELKRKTGLKILEREEKRSRAARMLQTAARMEELIRPWPIWKKKAWP